MEKAYAYGLLAVFMWATAASAFKLTLRHIDYISMLFFSTFFSMVVLTCVAIATKKFHMIWKQEKNDLAKSAIIGILNPFLYYMALFKAYSILPAQEALVLNYTWPIVLVIFSIFILKQKIKAINLFAILLSFFGVVIIITRGDVLGFRITNITGSLIALSTTILWASFWILNMKDKRDDAIKLLTNFLFGFAFIFAFSFPHLKFNFKGLLGCIYIGTFEMGITFFIWLKALQYANTTAQVGNLIYLSPFISLLLIHFIVGEEIYISTLAGLILIIAGIILQKH